LERNRVQPGSKEKNPMLVIRRKVGEEITIGDCITIKITQVRKSSVQVGISAPDGLLIKRGASVPVERKPPPPGNNPTDLQT
jgi:hypothetical protein